MHVRRVDCDTKQDVARFVEFPFELYRDCAQWVPPMVSSEHLALNRHKHPYYQHSLAQFFMVESNGKALGRIAVLENRNYNRHHSANSAFFGYFDVIDDAQASAALFEAAFDWAWRRGLDRVLGPRGLLGGEGGSVLVEGFEHRPAMGVPYNYPYYDRLITQAGFEKDTDFLSAHLNQSYDLPERVRAIAEKARARRNFWVKSFQSKREIRQWLPRFLEAHQRAFFNNHTYYPPTPAEAAALVKTVMWVVDPQLVKLIMCRDEIVGFVLGFRDLSAGLQRAGGRLWPLGWYHILSERQRTRWINLNGFGLVPEHRGLGADAVLLVTLDDTLRSTAYEHAYLVQTEEGNVTMINQALRLGVTWCKRHRSYTRVL
jgi:GNAT superfamily N-acetyltransferase